MIKGIDKIQQYLGGFPECSAIIGGTACDILLGNAGLDFRRTKDVDMIVIAEAISPGFVEKLREMIQVGGYQKGWTKANQVYYFRFDRPTNTSFPYMIELFTGDHQLSKMARDGTYTRLKYSTEYSPLSAILMDPPYYEFAKAGIITASGISIMSEDHLIPLKIRAWLDLSRKKAIGEHVNTDDILKHKKDVFRLCQIVIPNKNVQVSPPIIENMREFLNALDGSAESKRITGMGIELEFDEIIELLRGKYVLK